MASDVRKPPIGAALSLHQQGVRGQCGWCGLGVTERTPARGYLKLWHDDCSTEMGIITQPAQARTALFQRDRGICIDCTEDWSERFIYRKGSDVIVSAFWDVAPKYRQQLAEERMAGFWRYTELIQVSLWHADHRVPLWKVKHLPDIERLEYFKLANLVTRCEPCHIFKTKDEAAERAHLDRLSTIDAPGKTKRAWGSRPMGKWRGFPPKGSRPMRGK